MRALLLSSISTQMPPTCLAIVRFSAAGDIICTAGATAALARAWPNSKRIFVTHARYQSLVQHNRHIGSVCALRPKESLWSLVARLRALGVDALCDLHGSWRSRALWPALGFVRHSRLRKRDLHSFLAHTLAHAPYRPTAPLEARYHRAIEQLVGHALPTEPLHFEITAADRAHGDLLLRQAGASMLAPTVALLPGAAWATKRWPVRHFIATAKRLQQAGLQVIALGSDQEAPLTQAIVAAAPLTLNLGRAMPWGTMAHILSTCRAAVAGDTGPMHLARAVGTPCIVLFGSTPATQFVLPQKQVLVSHEHCSPCSPHGLAACPRGHLRCMTQLDPCDVWRALEPLLHLR